jgi:hypothetical protein
MAGHSGAWGNLRLRWHHWENATGFYRPAGFRLDLNDDMFAADVHVPTDFGTFELLGARQQNVRQAFPAPLGGRAAVDLKLVTFTGRVGFQHRPRGPLRGRLAVDYQHADNTPRALGELLPESRATTWP